MKHSSTRELFEYWNERRGRRPAPDRSDIDPGAIRKALADTFILTFDGTKGHPLRIAGTRICAAFGRELKGEAFIGLWAEDSRKSLRDLIHIVAHESVGAAASVGSVNAEGTTLDLELLLLPLARRLEPNRLLGALAPTEMPYWLGTSKLGELTLGTLRYLGPDVMPVRPHIVGLPPNGRRRHGLVIYDGGQA